MNCKTASGRSGGATICTAQSHSDSSLRILSMSAPIDCLAQRTPRSANREVSKG